MARLALAIGERPVIAAPGGVRGQTGAATRGELGAGPGAKRDPPRAAVRPAHAQAGRPAGHDGDAGRGEGARKAHVRGAQRHAVAPAHLQRGLAAQPLVGGERQVSRVRRPVGQQRGLEQPRVGVGHRPRRRDRGQVGRTLVLAPRAQGHAPGAEEEGADQQDGHQPEQEQGSLPLFASIASGPRSAGRHRPAGWPGRGYGFMSRLSAILAQAAFCTPLLRVPPKVLLPRDCGSGETNNESHPIP
jgi:hypothetical protein